MLKKTKILLGAVLTALTISTASLAAPVTNTGSGSIGGSTGSLTSGAIIFDVQQFTIQKLAFDLNNTLIPNIASPGTKVAKGQIITMVLAVDNVTPNQVNDLRLRDDFTTVFTYIAGSLYQKIDTGTGTAMTGAWLSGAGWALLTDALDPATDEGSIVGAVGAQKLTIGAEATVPQVNKSVNMAASKIYAYKFQVIIN